LIYSLLFFALHTKYRRYIFYLQNSLNFIKKSKPTTTKISGIIDVPCINSEEETYQKHPAETT